MSSSVAGDEGFPGGLQGAQKAGVLAVACIHPHPAKTHAPRPLCQDHLHSDAGFGFEDAFAGRDVRFFATRGIAGPVLREIEPSLQESDAASGGGSGEDPHLTTDRREMDSHRLPRRGERRESIILKT